jgi:hypothetical protein
LEKNESRSSATVVVVVVVVVVVEEEEQEELYREVKLGGVMLRWNSKNQSKTIHNDDCILCIERPPILMKLMGFRNGDMLFHPSIKGPGEEWNREEE